MSVSHDVFFKNVKIYYYFAFTADVKNSKPKRRSHDAVLLDLHGTLLQIYFFRFGKNISKKYPGPRVQIFRGAAFSAISKGNIPRRGALGATGARITGKAAQILKRDGGRYALSTQCIGGGQGIATVMEAL